jgi:hypothetical protein
VGKKKSLMYACLLTLTVVLFLVGIQFISTEPESAMSVTDTVKVTDVSLSTPSEIPSVNVIEVKSMPTDTVLKEAAIYNLSIIANGQGGGYWEYNPRIEGTRELVHLYVHNKGYKELDVRLVSPLHNKWIEASVAPGTIYSGEMNWGSEQAGAWHIDLNNADGSIIKADLALIRRY